MANSADPDQLASIDLHCLERQGLSGFSRSRVNYKVSIFFLFLHDHECCGYSTEAPHEDILMRIYMFSWRNKNIYLISTFI